MKIRHYVILSMGLLLAVAFVFGKPMKVKSRKHVYYVAKYVDSDNPKGLCHIRRKGYDNSRGLFWPASTVKIIAAVAMLREMKKYNIHADTRIKFKDAYGVFNGKVSTLFRMENIDYDRMVRLATVDGIDRMRKDLKYMYLTIRTLFGGPNRRIWNRPAITSHGIPARQNPWRRTLCASNCVSLYELQSIMHRIVNLDPTLGVPIKSLSALRHSLARKHPHTCKAMRKFFPGSIFYNKSGTVPKYSRLDNIAIPYKKGHIYITLAVKFSYGPWYANKITSRILTKMMRCLREE